MKKALLTTAAILLALFSMTMFSYAQEVSQSGREKGFVIRPELVVGYGPLMGSDSHCSTKYLQGTFVYQFNPHIDTGIGTGYCRNHWAYLGEGVDDFYLIPAYVSSRAYLCNRKVSPYIDLKLGYNISNKEGCILVDYGADPKYFTDYYSKLEGPFCSLTLGLQFHRIDVGLSWWRMKAQYRVIRNNITCTNENYWRTLISFNIAYNFQFKQSF